MANYNFLETFTFKNGVTLKNKVVMAPMTTMSSFYNGMVSKDELDYYAKRAGGPGMVITAVANVTPNGKGFEGELSATSDEMIPSLRSLAKTIQSKGAKAVLQIFHAGRKTFARIIGGEQPVSAGTVKALYPEDSETPRALTSDEIEAIIKDFGQATKRAIIAGFDGVELHGANTYLLQQFFSENSNQRTDKWGGNRDERMTFAKAVIKEVQSVIDKYATKPFILGYRLSPEEIEKPGIRLEDSLYFVKKIKHDVDYIHLSMGSYLRTSLNNPEDKKPILNYFIETIGPEVPLIGLGSVETPNEAQEVINKGASLVAMGRELLREPNWVEKVQRNDENSIHTTISASDMDELSIPTVMQTYLKTSFHSVMHFTTDTAAQDTYSTQMAPMEGIEKKL
ncbi:NADH-dependent flavin oxidoreductase [Lactobacillus sp. W8089]|nr:NADH-dependent flavin oxidoreductase [Lactobacillus sp. W8086]MBI0109229.1 NADH-dependent flavin oxidoreductase [Lactobacillus sp. W8085]MBI0112386.1 NADH-dependent flavin oxidoreductase [Lactobacillus sp. W8088]MBI0116161.1 NADH-dependent flavin oxidoreductase [Lactobacillus sp. W8087]MBI0119827.1 NADH-dependent flavin oxidoreductase [Lactobacillus sp. W8089]MBI0131792.1 NADH-dependent flavin oxidoreductase [Lactobacillus sp. W8090]